MKQVRKKKEENSREIDDPTWFETRKELEIFLTARMMERVNSSRPLGKSGRLNLDDDALAVDTVFDILVDQH